MTVRLITFLIALCLMAGCAEEPPPPPMVEVVVDTVVLDPYQPKASFVGRLHARDDVSIQAKVSGYLLSHNFREGELVKAGDLLYEIDPAEFEAQMSRARAGLAKAKANQVSIFFVNICWWRGNCHFGKWIITILVDYSRNFWSGLF